MASEIEKKTLTKMLYEHHVGGKHTSADNVPKGFAKHERGKVKKALKNLIREGHIIPKITSYGLEVSLNPRRLREIYEITREP
jgi:hypothetical protein